MTIDEIIFKAIANMLSKEVPEVGDIVAYRGVRARSRVNTYKCKYCYNRVRGSRRRSRYFNFIQCE